MSYTLKELEQIIEADGEISQGWGAVAVLSRTVLNHVLQQQFIQNYAVAEHVTVDTELTLSGGDGLIAQLHGIQLGPPLLSFETASLTDSQATLTMSFESGRFSVRRVSTSAPPLVHTLYSVAGQGFKLVMTIDLHQVIGEVDRQGRVTLDIGDAIAYTCNLAGRDEAVNRQLADLFKRHFTSLQPLRRTVNLAVLELWRLGPLTVHGFRILTQAAAGARLKGANNYGDGAVLLLMRLQADPNEGTFPVSSDFPYLIPRDTDWDNEGGLTASLLIHRDHFSRFPTQIREMLIPSLRFSHGSFFQPLVEIPETDDPFNEHCYFGRIESPLIKTRLEPAFATVQAGGRVDFTLYGPSGAVVPASQWHAVSFEGRLPVNHGTVSNGRYQAVSRADMGHELLHVLVTADYEVDNHVYSTSALVTVVYDNLAATPQVGSYSGALLGQPIGMTGFDASGADLHWSLRGNAHGRVTQLGANTAVFDAAAHVRRKSLLGQQVDVQGGATTASTLMFASGQLLLATEPYHVSKVPSASTVQLHSDAAVLAGLPRRWRVIGGRGNVDANGLFTAPDDSSSLASVVQCEVVHNDVVFANGYSVIELNDQEDEPVWTELVRFEVKVVGAVDPAHGSLLANGYQQLQIQVIVETALVDDKKAPLSAQELNTMQLVDTSSNQEVEFLPEDQGWDDGMREGDTEIWRVRNNPNRFELASPSGLASPILPVNNDSTRTKTFYLHTIAPANRTFTFHAKFKASATKKEWTSLGRSNGTVEITPAKVPVPAATEYDFKRERVHGGKGDGTNPDDDFHLHLITIDYWTLKYIDRSGEWIKFLRMEVVNPYPSVGAYLQTALIAWESEALWETMFSWTGLQFVGSEHPDGVTNIKIDPVLTDGIFGDSVTADIPEKLPAPEPGALVISLHRTDDVVYKAPADAERWKFFDEMHFLLRDTLGNPHKLTIRFGAVGSEGRRNELILATR
ncbi:hypothetical protein IFR09_25915 [Pseudomonas syringae]|nr:hypothetical protein [Pseudomonas syringae]MBD8790827.1 hypothetical protein [Pseudomonas syringae]MBD8802038.1 hypothetical protein [Pseudomonas syringae]MBD8814604.1 hypothetical protein [Pseudomonas syringae]